MGLNPAVLYAIADRLAQPAGKWQPFDRSGGARAWIYRDPRPPRLVLTPGYRAIAR